MSMARLLDPGETIIRNNLTVGDLIELLQNNGHPDERIWVQGTFCVHEVSGLSRTSANGRLTIRMN